jgi:hypothetical protein
MQPLGVGAHPRELRKERGTASALAGEMLHPAQATGDRASSHASPPAHPPTHPLVRVSSPALVGATLTGQPVRASPPTAMGGTRG